MTLANKLFITAKRSRDVSSISRRVSFRLLMVRFFPWVLPVAPQERDRVHLMGAPRIRAIQCRVPVR